MTISGNTHATLDAIDGRIRSRGALVLDGGLASELEKQGHDLNDDLWSARLLLTDPQAIYDVHMSYLEAGADCLTTASYQASFPGLAAIGLDHVASRDVILSSVEIAKRAVDSFTNSQEVEFRPLVAASVGPYGAYLADGSEYRGDYSVTHDELVDFHAPRLQLLAESEADLLAVETIPNSLEAEVLCELLNDCRKPAWMSFCCRNEGQISDGTDIGHYVAMIGESSSVFAVGVNCTAPGFVSSLIEGLGQQNIGKRIVVYPNSGQRYEIDTRSWRGESFEESFGDNAINWLRQGATLIGGCCQTGPDHIRQICNALDQLRPNA